MTYFLVFIEENQLDNTSVTSVTTKIIVFHKMFLLRYSQLISDRSMLRQIKQARCCFCSVQQTLTVNHLDTFKEFTGRKEEEVLAALRMSKHNYLQYLKEEEVKSRLNTFKNLQIGGCDNLIVMSMLKTHSVTLKNRFMILEEVGICKEMLTLATLKKYLGIMRLPVIALKDKKLMTKDNDVIKNLLKYLDLDETNCFFFKDSKTILEAKVLILTKYLKERFGMSEDLLQPTKPHMQRLKHKSFRVLKANIELCLNDIGFTTEKMISNPFLLYQNTENTYEIINQVKEIGGVDIRKVLKSYPKILSEPVENIHEIKVALKEFNIPEKMACSLKRLLTLKADTIRQRFMDLDNIEFLSACKNHPRVIDLIYSHNKVAKRLRLLDEIRLNSVTVNTLASTKKVFNRYCTQGFDRNAGRDIIYFLCKELNGNKAQLRLKLKRHPFWEHIPLVHIYKNTKYLKERFTIDELYTNIYILLYPLQKIETELEIMESRPELNNFKTDGKVRRDMILPLVIYYIEKANNFNYHGVWDYESENQQLAVDAPLQYKVSV